MNRYRVHIYALVRVPVEVRASSPEEACRQADISAELYELLDYDGAEFAEEVVDYLVDELDENGELVSSKTFNKEDIYKIGII